jgi:hypothetical protein
MAESAADRSNPTSVSLSVASGSRPGKRGRSKKKKKQKKKEERIRQKRKHRDAAKKDTAKNGFFIKLVESTSISQNVGIGEINHGIELLQVILHGRTTQQHSFLTKRKT